MRRGRDLRGEQAKGDHVPSATCAPLLLYFLPISMRVGSSISFPWFWPLEYISFWLPKLGMISCWNRSFLGRRTLRRILRDMDTLVFVERNKIGLL